MKKLISITLIYVFALIAFGIQAGTTEKPVFNYPIHQTKLSNGLNVVTVPYDSPGIAAFYIVVRVGSREEVEPGKTGFAHFFEHMMFRGTDKFPKHKYTEVLKSTGASANANTSLDRTVYHMTGDVDKLETMFMLEADRFQNLKYSVQDFKTEAGAVKGEYTKNNASPLSQLYEAVQNTAFDNHTYKHTTMGFFKDIVDMPNQYEYSIEFFNRFYRPEYCTIIVVGDVKAVAVNALATKYFGKWKKGNHVTKIPTEPEQSETKKTHIQVTKYPPHLSLNFKGASYSDLSIDNAAIGILNLMLFSDKSTLYDELVNKEQKARSISGYNWSTRDPNLITVSASLVNKDDLQYVKDAVMKTIEKAANGEIDEKKMAEAKSYLKYSFAMSLDNPSSIANSLSQYVWLTGDPNSINRMYDNYAKVTKADLVRVAQRYYTSQRLTIATISSDSSNSIQ